MGGSRSAKRGASGATANTRSSRERTEATASRVPSACRARRSVRPRAAATDVIEQMIGDVLVAVRDLGVALAAREAAAAHDASRRRSGWTGRIACRRLLVVLVHIPIRAPLPDVAGHVEGAVRAGAAGEAAHRRRLLERV